MVERHAKNIEIEMYNRQKTQYLKKKKVSGIHRANAITQLTQHTAMRCTYLRHGGQLMTDFAFLQHFSTRAKTSTKCMTVIWGNTILNAHCAWICFRFWMCRTAFLYTVKCCCYQKFTVISLPLPCHHAPPSLSDWLRVTGKSTNTQPQFPPPGPEIHRQRDRIQNREKGSR